jgi:hypothetical protein
MNAGFDNTYPLEDADFKSLAKQLTLNIRSKTTFSPAQSLIVASRYNRSKEDLDLHFDFRTFFQNYKAINTRFLAERIGMNQSLHAQYTSGVKTPS